jgi:hypothetical protein
MRVDFGSTNEPSFQHEGARIPSSARGKNAAAGVDHGMLRVDGLRARRGLRDCGRVGTAGAEAGTAGAEAGTAGLRGLRHMRAKGIAVAAAGKRMRQGRARQGRSGVGCGLDGLDAAEPCTI